MRKLLSLVLFTFTLTSASTLAATETAYDVVSQVGDSLFSRIKNESTQLKTNPAALETIVEQELMPYVDYRYTGLKILGKHIRTTTKEQREQFIEAMRHYLVKTYASALKQYNNQQVTFYPPKDEDGKIVAVTAMIRANGQQDIDVVFKMRQDSKTLQWKAFDMVVEGISLLSSKQAEINRTIREHGIDKTTSILADAGQAS